jgi:hypothetical protein
VRACLWRLLLLLKDLYREKKSVGEREGSDDDDDYDDDVECSSSSYILCDVLNMCYVVHVGGAFNDVRSCIHTYLQLD